MAIVNNVIRNKPHLNISADTCGLFKNIQFLSLVTQKPALTLKNSGDIRASI